MDYNSINWGWAVGIVAVIVAIIAWVRSPAEHKMDVATLEGVVESNFSLADELTKHALTGVQAAEQLWRSGKITRGERFSSAITYLRTWFPDLDEDSLVKNIEAAVLVVNTLVANLPAVKEAVNRVGGGGGGSAPNPPAGSSFVTPSRPPSGAPM